MTFPAPYLPFFIQEVLVVVRNMNAATRPTMPTKNKAQQSGAPTRKARPLPTIGMRRSCPTHRMVHTYFCNILCNDLRGLLTSGRRCLTATSQCSSKSPSRSRLHRKRTFRPLCVRDGCPHPHHPTAHLSGNASTVCATSFGAYLTTKACPLKTQARTRKMSCDECYLNR